jgi:cobalt-zinc-cadmium efflux system membrane fusion protein
MPLFPNNSVRSSRALAVSIVLGAILIAPACRKENAEQTAETSPAKAPDGAEPKENAPLAPSVTIAPAAIAAAGIKTWRVEPVPLANRLVVNGSITFDENRVVITSSAVGGRVAQIPVDLGASVTRGQPVVWLESMELGRLRQEYLRAVTEAGVAEKSFRRAEMLVREKAISAGEFQTREGDYRSKAAGVSSAAASLRQVGDSTEAARSASGVPRVAVRAPFAGTVIDRKVTPGTLVEALHPLVTVANLDTLWAFFHVYEKDLSAVKQGLDLTITADAYPGETFPGVIDFVGSEVDASTRTVRVRATVRNPERQLRPGLFVKGIIRTAEGGASAAVAAVPQSALQTIEGRQAIFVRIAPDKFALRFVETGKTFDEYIEVLSGVKAGEEVVTDGSFVVKSEFLKATLADED